MTEHEPVEPSAPILRPNLHDAGIDQQASEVARNERELSGRIENLQVSIERGKIAVAARDAVGALYDSLGNTDMYPSRDGVRDLRAKTEDYLRMLDQSNLAGQTAVEAVRAGGELPQTENDLDRNRSDSSSLFHGNEEAFENQAVMDYSRARGEDPDLPALTFGKSSQQEPETSQAKETDSRASTQ